jgi:hypothetical protein
VQSLCRKFSLPQRGRYVIEPDLNCSELVGSEAHTASETGRACRIAAYLGRTPINRSLRILSRARSCSANTVRR